MGHCYVHFAFVFTLSIIVVLCICVLYGLTIGNASRDTLLFHITMHSVSFIILNKSFSASTVTVLTHTQ